MIHILNLIVVTWVSDLLSDSGDENNDETSEASREIDATIALDKNVTRKTLMLSWSRPATSHLAVGYIPTNRIMH